LIEIQLGDDSEVYSFVIGNVPEEFIEWLSDVPHCRDDLIGNDKYVDAQATCYDEPVVHIQIEGEEYNRPYGAAINIKCPKLWEILKKLLKRCEVDGEFIC